MEDVKWFFEESKFSIISYDAIAFAMSFLRYFIKKPKLIAVYDFLDNKDYEGFNIISTNHLSHSDDGLDPKRFSKALLNEKAVEFIKKEKNPLIFGYIVKEDVLKVCRQMGWKSTGYPNSSEIEDKFRLREMLVGIGLPVVEGETLDVSGMPYKELAERFGEMFVMQLPKGMAGKGTFVVKNEEEYKKSIITMNERGGTKCTVCRYIKGNSPSLTACVTRKGTLVTRPGRQLLSDPALVNRKLCGYEVFCGAQWSDDDGYSEWGLEKFYDYAKKIGKRLYEMGYRGIFNLDAIFDEENKEVYIVDINPRLPGSMCFIPMLQAERNEIQIAALHIMEFMEKDFDFDFNALQEKLLRKRKGSHLILFTKHEVPSVNRSTIKPGVYKTEKGKLVFVRKGYALEHIKSPEEFIITGGVPYEGMYYVPHKRLCRFLTKKSIIDSETGMLNEWARERVELIYRKFDFIAADD